MAIWVAQPATRNPSATQKVVCWKLAPGVPARRCDTHRSPGCRRRQPGQRHHHRCDGMKEEKEEKNAFFPFVPSSPRLRRWLPARHGPRFRVHPPVAVQSPYTVFAGQGLDAPVKSPLWTSLSSPPCRRRTAASMSPLTPWTMPWLLAAPPLSLHTVRGSRTRKLPASVG